MNRTTKSRCETQIQVNLGGHDLSSSWSQCGNGGSRTYSRNSRQRRGGVVSSAYFLLHLLGVCPSYFFPFKFQLLFSLLKPRASQKFWSKSLRFPLITRNTCHLRNVHYIQTFVQRHFRLFYLLKMNSPPSFFTVSFYLCLETGPWFRKWSIVEEDTLTYQPRGQSKDILRAKSLPGYVWFSTLPCEHHGQLPRLPFALAAWSIEVFVHSIVFLIAKDLDI